MHQDRALRFAHVAIHPHRRFASDSTPTHCSSGAFFISTYARRLEIGPNTFDPGGNGRYGRVSTCRSRAQVRWPVSQPPKGGCRRRPGLPGGVEPHGSGTGVLQLLHEGRLQLRRVRQPSVQQFELVLQQWRLGLLLRESPSEDTLCCYHFSVVTYRIGIPQLRQR